MSTLHHETILETCFEEVCEEFASHNKLTPDMLEHLLSDSKDTLAMLEEVAMRRFEELAQWKKD